MQITAADLAFYESKRRPQWAAHLAPARANVHAAINARAGQRSTTVSTVTHNTVSLMRLIRGNIRRARASGAPRSADGYANLADALVSIAATAKDARRRRLAARWAVKLGVTFTAGPVVEYAIAAC